MKYKLTASQLEHWLRKKEYSSPMVSMKKSELQDPDYLKMERNNRILGRSFHHTFEKWVRKWGRIPTPQEFIAMQMQDIRRNFSNPAWKRKHRVTFKWTPLVEKGIKNRLLRSYKSFINELHTELLIKELFPQVEIYRNDELDFAGIDLLVFDKKEKIDHKIHITKASEYAIDFLFKKEGRSITFRGYESKLWAVPVWKKDNSNPIYRKRDFTGHTFFLYSDKPTDETRIVNGYPLFKREYVKNKLEVNILLRAG